MKQQHRRSSSLALHSSGTRGSRLRRPRAADREPRDEKRLRRMEGYSYVLRARHDPIVDLHDAYIVSLDDHFIEDASLLDRLIARCRDELHCDRIFIRVRADAQFETGTLRLYEEFLLKARATPETRPDGLTGVPVQTSDSFVRGLLLRGTMNAYTSLGLFDRYRSEWAETFVDTLATMPEVRSVIGVVDGSPVGHVTWLAGIDDEVTGEALDEIVDVYVLEEYRSHGYSQQFVSLLEGAFPSTRRIHGSVLNEGVIPSPVSRGLLNVGWTADFNLWVSE